MFQVKQYLLQEEARLALQQVDWLVERRCIHVLRKNAKIVYVVLDVAKLSIIKCTLLIKESFKNREKRRLL